MKKFNSSAFNKLMKYTIKYWKYLLLVIVTALIEVFASLYSVIKIGDAVDCMVEQGNVDFNSLSKICILIGLLVLVYVISEWLMELFASTITSNVVRDIRHSMFEAIQKVPLSYIDSNKTGTILSKMIVDVDQIYEGLLMSFNQLFSGIGTILATIAIMMSINYKIGLIVVCITPVSLVIATLISKSTHKYFKKQSELRSDISAQVTDAATNPTLYKTCNFGDRSEEIFDDTNKTLEKVSIKGTFYSSLTNPSTRFVNNVIYALAGLIGAFAVINGGAFSLTVGQFTMFLTYALKYGKPFNEISDVFTEIESATASAERVFEVIEALKEKEDSSDSIVLKDVQGNIELKDVAFSYSKDKKLIENLNLNASHGTNIAIVGRTGCGKTTLINLLMRFYDIDAGSIKIDGNNIYDVTRNSLRSSYGMVLQESYIFSGTIRDNILFGRNATEDEVIEAATKAHAYNFIKRLPQGLDTVISEGSNLSEGQKQLLCIARAMLYLPNMLILDEATSSVDTRTEIKIQQAFDEMMKGRTCFVVAHRLSTIKKADCILVMDKGHIIEQGTHSELLEKGGLYSELYNSQFAKN